jgi:5S rRNA maturation endonuclease (ribonuclease M5)
MAKELARIIERLKSKMIFVEGKRDKEALVKMGCDYSRVLTISGNLRISCERAKNETEVIILTDMDRRGFEMLKKASETLEEYGVKPDIETRTKLAHILRFKYFEEMYTKYEKFIEENMEN